MRVGFAFDGAHILSALADGWGLGSQQPFRTPSGFGNEPDDRSGPGRRAARQNNPALVAGEGSPSNAAVLPCWFTLRAELLGYAPAAPFSKGACALSSPRPMETPPTHPVRPSDPKRQVFSR